MRLGPFLLLLIVLAILSVGEGRAQELGWMRQFEVGLVVDTWTLGLAVQHRDAASIYIAGTAVDALPGQRSVGNGDAFVRGYQAQGYELWTDQFGSPAFDTASALAADASGVYVVGLTQGALPGQSSADSGARLSVPGEAFVRKYDLSGTQSWTRQFRSTASDVASGIAVEGTSMYVAGWTAGSLAGQLSAGLVDAFVRKLDADGMEAWTRQFGGATSDWAFGTAAAPGGVYVAGQTAGVLAGQASAGLSDGFVLSYDADGQLVWTRQFGSNAGDAALGIAADATGIYVVGFTYGALPGQLEAAEEDAFVRKYAGDGTELWTRQFGTLGNDRARALTLDASGVYVAGRAEGAFPGQRLTGSADVFVRKYDLEGNELWTRQFGNAVYNEATGIAVDGTGLYVAGCAGEYVGLNVGCGGTVLAFIGKRTLEPVPIATSALPANTNTVTEVMVVTVPAATTTATLTRLPAPFQSLLGETVYALVAAVTFLGAWVAYRGRRHRASAMKAHEN